MLGQVKTINNVKQIVPLTADIGSGNPIGTILPLYKKSTPNGYLYCDGSTFDTTAYPGLYAYLGTNVLPDYREFALVGAEENTTSSNIANHDVYSQGQEKDDQLQDHKHNIKTYSYSGAYSTIQRLYSNGRDPIDLESESVKFARAGTVTRGKRKAVYFYIKATTGLDENQQDYVLDTLNNTLRQQRSYSTDEHLTGKYWIDGKPIYSITIPCTTQINFSTGNWVDITSGFGRISTIIASIDTLVMTEIRRTKEMIDNSSNVLINYPQQNAISIYPTIAGNINIGGSILLEYTKTTD